MIRAWLPILSAAAMAWSAIPASAQMVVSAKSGVVNYTEGQVLLNGRAVESSITKYPEMKEDAVLRTEAGRVEVLLTPGVILRMGENTTLKLITNRLVDTRPLPGTSGNLSIAWCPRFMGPLIPDTTCCE